MSCTRSLTVLAFVLCLVGALGAQEQPAAGAQTSAGAAAKNVGVVKSISGTTLVLKTDAGPEITVSVSDGARIVRLAPGQTDLKNAAPLTLQELQVGDRMLVRGRAGDNNAM